MKYVVILTDGLADETYPELGGKSPMEVAEIPRMNELAAKGEIGLVQTIPTGMAPGSDVANLSVIGYDPLVYHTGRSPLEAISMGIELAAGDATMRANLVSLSGPDGLSARTMEDYSAGEIGTDEAHELVRDLKRELDDGTFTLHAGISYRHALVWHHPTEGLRLTPPHDISGRAVADHLPQGPGSERFRSLMERSMEILAGHPVNERRRAKGLRTADALWFWGMGRRTTLDPFEQLYGVRGAVISAVDLIKGIAIAAGMRSIDVPGATGTIHTNFRGKAQAAVDALANGVDYVYIHLEAPDECSHQGLMQDKIRSAKLIEREVLEPVLSGLSGHGWDHRILILPDHPTPLRLRTHTADPVPYVLYDSTQVENHPDQRFSERSAAASGRLIPSGPALARRFLQCEKRG